MKKIFEKRPCLTKSEMKDYLNQRLSKAVLLSVENHLLDCILCSEAVEGYASSHSLDQQQEPWLSIERRVQNQDAWKVSGNIRTMKSPTASWRRYLTAASVLLVIGFSALLYWQSTESNRLFSNYFEPIQDDMLNVTRSAEGGVINPSLEQGIQMVNDQKFEQALALLESVLNEDPENSLASIYTGMAYLETGQTNKAVEMFQVTRINHSELYEDATWYLALTYVKMEQYADAQAILDELLAYGSAYYKTKASDLKDQLSTMK